MLIDGKLVDADSGKTFTNTNPATEEAIGEVADASAAEMQRAIVAARHAFDETDWSTNHAFRKQCLEQLQEALDAEREELREQLILEVGCPRMITAGPQLDSATPSSSSTSSSGRSSSPTGSTSWASPTSVASGRSPQGWSAPSCRGTSPSR
jgi:aldehyde dehydrogenase (NAD+)